MTTKEKIRTLSKALRYVSYFLLILAPLFNIGYWVTNGYEFLGAEWSSAFQMMFPKISEAQPLAQLSSELKFLALLVTFIPFGIFMLAVMFLGKLFKLYEEFKIFSAAAVRCIRSLGITLLIGQLLHPIYYGLFTLTMTISNPPGHRSIGISYGSDQFLLLMIAAIIILISWIMDEGRKLEEEQTATV
jgi:hypothetical protein